MTDRALLDYLLTFVTPHKQRRFAEVLDQRTRRITVVLEDVYQPHNISAVLRSCDCFGVQDVHIVENEYAFEVNPDVALGAQKWLTIHRHQDAHDRPSGDNVARCLAALQQRGFQVLTTSPQADALPLEEVDISQPTAIVFGHELEGVSDIALKMADRLVTVPMYGFTESLNISVAAAICLQSLTSRLRRSDVAWPLTSEERAALLLDWARSAVPNVEPIERRFVKSLRNDESEGA